MHQGHKSEPSGISPFTLLQRLSKGDCVVAGGTEGKPGKHDAMEAKENISEKNGTANCAHM